MRHEELVEGEQSEHHDEKADAKKECAFPPPESRETKEVETGDIRGHYPQATVSNARYR